LDAIDDRHVAQRKNGTDIALSIVVVNWNTRDLLLRLLGQLLANAPVPCEVIVVDNHSSDDSVTAAWREFPNAIVLPQPKNGGFAYGVNRGLERAHGRWILLLNTDAEVTWQDLQDFVAAAEREPTAAVFGPRIVDERGRTQPSTWQRHLPRHYLPRALFLGRLVDKAQPTAAADVDCVSGCVFLIRASVLAQVGGFDERFFMYYEEADFCRRVREAGHGVRWLPSTSFVHVGGLSAEQAAEKTFLAFRESCLLYHVKWSGRAWTEWVRACLLLGILLRLLAWAGLAAFGRRNRAKLYWSAAKLLAHPGYVGALSRRPRLIPKLPAAAR
jgi:N-acetylglucosaminyl-diphospho-decaprenol L-rhamnosyltransferase